MTSSGSFELALSQGGVTHMVSGSLRHPGAVRILSELVRSSQRIVMELRSSDPVALEARCGTRVLAVLTPERSSTTVDVSAELRDLHGETVIEVLARDAEGEPGGTLLTVHVALDADAVTQALRQELLADVSKIHVGLAHDVLGSSAMSLGWTGETGLFDPATEHTRLLELEGVLRTALATIGAQPSTILERHRDRARWRPGDRLDAGGVRSLVRDEQLVMRAGRVVSLGVVESRKTRMTLDLAEHRHLRAGLLLLARRANRLVRACERAASLLAEEERRWGIRNESGESIFEQRFAPRIRRFEQWADQGARLETRFRSLVESHAFLRGVGAPRSALEPTPLFLSRAGYREAYQALRAAASQRGLAVDSDEVRIRMRDLDTLYEYWTYIKIVEILRAALGSPEPEHGFRIIDEMYRPDLQPGQTFSWPLAEGGRLYATYEPALPRERSSDRAPFGMRSSLVGAPLRPDILLVHERPGRPLRALALDAKNTTSFDRRRLWASSDYRTLIHDETTGEQPIRWLFFLHRTNGVELCSYPGFFADRPIPETTSLLGCLPMTPAQTDAATSVIRRFLAVEGEVGVSG